MSAIQTGVTFRRGVAAAMLAAALCALPGHAAETKAAGEGKAKAAAVIQKTYATPEEAVKALIAAARAQDSRGLLAVLGRDARAIVSSGDTVADREGRERFVKAYDEANKLDKSGEAMVLTVGKDAWPLPIPLVKDEKGWRFDAKAGREEILNRRIGRNELYTIQSVLAYVDAQREYYLRNPQNDKLLNYAQKFVSAKGRKDGLYFPTKAGEPQSPLGPLFVAARAEGYGKGEGGKPLPYHGYHYRILKGQGPDAKGGAYDYVAQGKMIGGFALVAWPANYGNTGVMTFIVNHDGVVYEKDLGPDTAAAEQKVTKFNPDKTWKRVERKGT
ncbi:MAG: DUF2950 domain-containing protein [Burkholderiales bacterium]|nr:DUF2950 domain-containing protein [Burkholderiales bacterium]